ncbi:MAG: phosphoribosylaminoimidazolesuccinocarboxamide synthase [Chloroflexota bacterium]
MHPCLSSGADFPPPLSKPDLPGLPVFSRGKVRDMIDLGDHLLMVASDRVSAFDVIMREPIPGKGIVLTSFSEFWFEQTRKIIQNHLVSANVSDFPSAVEPYKELLEGRAMLVRKAQRIDIECVVRGYIAGSAWAEYRRHGTMAGEPLPAGLMESERLPAPLFTPATKSDTGHDENISMSHMREAVGATLADQLRDVSVALYSFAEKHARKRGIILADTKFEFGLIDGEITLIDEVLTPDSSRFWPANVYMQGRSQESFDKQYLRDYLESTGWNKEPPPPALPDEVIQQTAEKYREAYQRVVAR